MSLPIIDLHPYLTNQTNTKEVALQIRSICKQTGFFYIKNHGVPQELQKSILANSQKFFALPKSAKREISMNKGGIAWRGYFQVGEQQTSGKMDLKQGLYLGPQLSEEHPMVQSKTPLHGPNLFPKQVPELKADILRWLSEMDRLGDLLMQAVAESLFLERSYLLQTTFKEHLASLRIFHYPYYQNSEGLWGVGEHSDYGILTILMIMDKGLQVKNLNNQWIQVEPLPNTFIINIGDLLQKMTRGLYRSTPHRVLNTTQKSRYSIPYFYDAGWNSPIRELDIKVDEEEIELLKKNNAYERWDKVDLHTISGNYGDYLMGKLSKIIPQLAQEEQ